MTSRIDDMFTPGGAAVALSNGCRLAVSITDSATTPDVYLTEDDLTCGICGRGFDTPEREPLRFIALNKVLNSGLCRRCDPVIGPRPPEDFEP